MKKTVAAADPDAYVAGLRGWRRACVIVMRDALNSPRRLEERIKWGNIVYFAGGPVAMIRAEEDRVLLGFWRGQRLRDLEPRLKPGGKYEMATMELRKETKVTKAALRRLVARAVELNAELGDPTSVAGTR